MSGPNPDQIKAVLLVGGLEAVEELYYPGEKSRNIDRIENYPKPEGSGRDPFPDVTSEVVFSYDDRRLGVWGRSRFYANNIYIGTIDSVRRGFLNTFYRTQDGQEFAHWGGSTGAHTYLVERYWRYGDPPRTWWWRRLRRGAGNGREERHYALRQRGQ